MSIMKIEVLGRDRVRVSELMTFERLLDEAQSLAEDGMYAQASLYAAMANSVKSRGWKPVWDTVFSGHPTDLDPRQFDAMRAAQHSGRTRAVVCIY